MTLPTFLDARLDQDIEQGAVGGPNFLTTVMELAGGTEKRNIEWSLPRQTWDISYGIQSPEDFAAVVNMFYNCFGRAIGFRFQDWADYQIGDPVNYTVSGAQQFATGDASTLAFQLMKSYTTVGLSSNYTFFRKITRPQTGTLKLYVNNVLKTEGVDFTVNYDTGLVTFAVAPGNGLAISASLQFDVPVRFDADVFKQKMTWTGATELPSIQIIELRE